VPLFRRGTPRYTPVVDAFDIGYVMGLVVGEGTFTGDRRQPVLQVKMNARDPFPLRRLSDLLGGRVYGPYNHDGRNYFLFMLRGTPLREAVPLFRRYLPESWKREQFERWLERYERVLDPYSDAAALSDLSQQSATA
jgi:hypothetical protein